MLYFLSVSLGAKRHSVVTLVGLFVRNTMVCLRIVYVIARKMEVVRCLFLIFSELNNCSIKRFQALTRLTLLIKLVE